MVNIRSLRTVFCIVLCVVHSICIAKNKRRGHRPRRSRSQKQFSLLPTKKTKKVSKISSHRSKIDFEDFFAKQEAKLSDVPIPIHAKAQRSKALEPCTKDVVLAYKSRLSGADLTHFYVEQMERMGWQQVSMFSAQETLINFAKPTRFCAVSIRPKKNGSDFVVFVS